MAERTFRLALVICPFLFVNLFSPANAQYFKGYLLRPQGSDDCNPCVTNVIESVNSLRDYGDPLGFNWGADYPEVSGAGTSDHWQGVARMPIIPGTGLDRPYVIVSSSHKSGTAHFAVVEFASRDTDLLRLRSNRLEVGLLPGNVSPNPSDRIVRALEITPDYWHPGGIQAIGKYILVGCEADFESPLYSLWDMSLPSEPFKVWERTFDGASANSVGIVRLQDGRYLMLRAESEAKQLDFYIHQSSDLADNNWILWDYWHYTELNPEGIDTNWIFDCDHLIVDGGRRGYQNTNLATDCQAGQVYLIASHGRCPESSTGRGSDFVDAYRLDVPTERPSKKSDYREAGVGVIITKVAERRMHPEVRLDFDNPFLLEFQGDLQAAGGMYVSPDNKLYFYATEHGRDGPGNSVKMIEWAPQVPVSKVETIDQSWVTLYEHDSFSGKSIILDYKDRDLRDYSDFENIEDWLYNFDVFGNPIRGEITSIIYGIPLGHKLRFYNKADQGGAYLDLNGTGRPERIVHLRDATMSDGNDANDKFRSAEWDAAQASEVWVDFSFGGDGKDGTFDKPHNNMHSGLAGVRNGGVIRIKSGSSTETLTINKPVTIQASGGSAVIGKQ